MSDPSSVRADAFDYELPSERIAHQPAEPRDAARLLVVNGGGSFEDRHVRDLVELLDPGDLLVVNDTLVIPARLFGAKPTGGAVEVLLLERLSADRSDSGFVERWRAMFRASRVPRRGQEVRIDDACTGTMLSEVTSAGTAEIEFVSDRPLEDVMQQRGHVPLPPYIERAQAPTASSTDRSRYQCVYAREPGAVAAPTAGLHFTPVLLDALRDKGVGLATITLHVGEATFRTPRVGEPLPSERFALSAQASDAIARTRRSGGRVVAVGTTVTRTLESRPETAEGGPRPGQGRTDLVIGPGHEFRFVDALMTNFHLPRTTLLMLVCAFGGTRTVMSAYDAAIERGYRFYSYGDAMLLRRPA